MSISSIRIFKESVQDVRENWREWIRVFFAPVVIGLSGLILKVIVCGWLSEWSIASTLELFTETTETQNFDDQLLLVKIANLVCLLTEWISFILLIIKGCRYAVLRERGDSWWTLSLNRLFMKQILYSTVIGVLWWLYVILSSFMCLIFYVSIKNMTLTVILAVFLGFGGLCLITRIGLTYVLTSIDQRKPLKLSWQLMRGNVLRLTGFSILICSVFLFLGLMGVGILGGMGWFLYSLNPWFTVIAVIPLAFYLLLVLFLFFAIGFKFMALVYKALGEKMPKTSMQPSGSLQMAVEA